MQVWEAAAITGAGAVAGAINAAVGSGTLISFPTLLALGYPPVVANISNNLGLVPGSLAGAWGYRTEITAVGRRVLALAAWGAAGAVAGAIALLRLPASAFDTVVPVLILLAVLLVLLQPRLAARVAGRSRAPGATGSGGSGASKGEATAGAMRGAGDRRVGPLLAVCTMAAGVYGGYFGAAQGVLLLGLFGWLLTDSLQHANGVKNLVSAAVNGTAAVVFSLAAPERVDWAVVALIAVGAGVGGVAGARLSRRLPPLVLRSVIVAVGLVAVARLTLG